jgi:hypothetical protein
MALVEARVRPDRLKQGSIVNPNRWWMHARSAADLYTAIHPLRRVLVRCLTSTQFQTFTFLDKGCVYDQTLIVFAFKDHAPQCVLCSRVHEIWARFLGATFKDDGRYNLADCFRTFPFPVNFETDATLEEAGQAYHAYRAKEALINAAMRPFSA